MEDTLTLSKDQIQALRELKEKSTQVVRWYPHSQYDGYHPGKASVRGPFGRWMLIEGGEHGLGEYGTGKAKLGEGVADLYDDAKFAAAAMNSLPTLLNMIETKDKTIQDLRGCIGQLSRPDLGDVEKDVWAAYRSVRDHSDHLRNELDRKNKEIVGLQKALTLLESKIDEVYSKMRGI